MRKIAESFFDLIGNTPLYKPVRFCEQSGIKNATVLAKLERFNPAGSVKDRIAAAMLLSAKEKGVLKENSVIIEPTSGNTGIGLAAAACSLGYRIILVMPDSMSLERRQLLKAYGAELVLTEGAKGMSGAVEKAKELLKEHENGFIPSQFENPENPNAHYNTTAREIYDQTDGRLDIFVAGVGTGGTISGISRYLKEKNPNIRIVAVEPASSPLLSQGKAGSHKLQGLGANFIPDTLDIKAYDEIITVSNEDAIKTQKALVKAEGIFCGISSGAALWAATVLAQRDENKGKTIVTLFPDTGERYLSMLE